MWTIKDDKSKQFNNSFCYKILNCYYKTIILQLKVLDVRLILHIFSQCFLLYTVAVMTCILTLTACSIKDIIPNFSYFYTLFILLSINIDISNKKKK